MRIPVKTGVLTRAGAFLKRNRGMIFTVGSAIGVVVTAVLSANAAIKAEEILKDEALKDAGKAEKAAKVLPKAIPAAVAAGGTIALIFLNHAANRKDMAALTALYALTAKKFADYKQATADIAGEDAAADIAVNAVDIAREKIPPEEYEDGPTSADDRLYYDVVSERYFWSTPEIVSDAEFYLNRIFALRDQATLNDFYRLLKQPEVEYGDLIGWDSYLGEVYFGYRFIDVTHIEIDTDNSGPDRPPYTEIFFPFEPHALDEETLNRELDRDYERLLSQCTPISQLL